MSRGALVALLIGAAAAARADAGAGHPLRDKELALWRRAAARTEEIARQLDGIMGVSVLDLQSGQTFLLRGGETFPAASVIKLGVLLALHRAAETKALELGERAPIPRAAMAGDEGLLSQLGDGTTAMALGDLAAAMIVLSENTATNLLIDRLGLPRINDAMRRAGLQRTVLARRMLDRAAARAGRENLTTPEDMLRLLERIYRGQALSPAATRDYLRLLRVPDKAGSALTLGVPEGVPVLNKPGELEGVRNDCGVIEEPGRPYVICIFTTFLRSGPEGAEAMARVARTWYELMHRLATSSEHGRALGPRAK